ncbi:protein kinase [Streptosporangium sp. NPDC002544]|uniref:serine/threonine-protein kinase n=1 Tax=Streptosporangium sp. NPDC002544 TaxID=3154538 RepID=UPI0033271F01
MPEQQMRVLADRYELIAPLGRGTMGTVWKAHDRSLGREVAIKEIRQEPGLSEAQRTELRERMIREGRTAARISHPSVATVHDAIVEDGSPWIIMELVQARSLEQVIEEEGPLPPRLVAEIGADLLGALRAAHAQGVLHRDVKPGNVLITENGRVVLTDFGIAKAEGDTSLTKTGMVIGSPGYTAPERARGEHNGPESDLWSLGATLYFAVEGRPAYERASVAETLAALMSEQVDPPTQAGPLRPVLEQLLEKDHTARLTAAQAGAMLRAVADTPSHLADSIPAAPAPAPPPPASETPVAPDAEEDDTDGFDADRTMVVIRPKGGLRIPGGTAPVAVPPASPPPAAAPGRTTASPYPDSPPLAEPGGPVPGRQGPPGLGTPVARGPATAGRGPGAFGRQENEHGFPDSGKPDLSATPPHGFPAIDPEFGAPVAGRPEAPAAPPHGPLPGDRPAGPGAPVSSQPWRPPGPESSDGVFGRSPGLGTDLFAIAGQNGRHAPGAPGAPGERQAPSKKPPIGILVLMGVAAIALVVIMILVVAAFS